MDIELILGILGNTVVLAGIAALWKWWSGRQEKSSEYHRQRETDEREHLQAGQADALKSVIGVNELLVKNLIGDISVRILRVEDVLNERLGGLEDVVRPTLRMLADVKAQMEVVNRDWSRVDEIVSDIDLVMHRLEAALQAGEYGKDKESTH